MKFIEIKNICIFEDEPFPRDRLGSGGLKSGYVLFFLLAHCAVILLFFTFDWRSVR